MENKPYLMSIPLYMRYWGKAKKDPDQGGDEYHLLAYHCLDVAAVAEVWWDNSPAIRQSFVFSFDMEPSQAKAWVLFFIALHDYGKWDIRFQRKAPDVWKSVNPDLASIDAPLSEQQIRDYFHGPEGLAWLLDDCSDRFSAEDWLSDDNDDWDQWLPWMAAVAGHHGEIPLSPDNQSLPLTCQSVGKPFKNARLAWLRFLEQLFLVPVDLSLKSNPPLFLNANKQGMIMLAGFCSVSDWLGSSDFFPYDKEPQTTDQDLADWYDRRFALADKALRAAGIISQIKPKANISQLLEGYSPRQVQCLLDDIPIQQSLTLIEASTGSGKTESALAYAWKLLEQGVADSIIFALPTQATANAMLGRLEKAAPILFKEQSNLILAHGRAKYQQEFINLQEACKPQTLQGKDEAWVQCGEWLAQSRKRVFLGQVGVCTIDQVLVSVLPVRHKFVRGFGIGRSVLIVDEVHAYDSYMYGLLSGVLEQQRTSGGSAILLSATLPTYQKQQLAWAWNCKLEPEEQKPYPLINHCISDKSRTYNLDDMPEQKPPVEQVHIELLENEDVLPDTNLFERIVDAVEAGAQVCVVCNLVDVAQQLFQEFGELFEQSSKLNADQINLFHSRFTFKDRQSKEKSVLKTFGKDPEPKNAREKGHLLIATQVVEQSLDVDFDWMITQLCPVDLLFQRMGRLHRHQQSRPAGFEKKQCTILAPDSFDYQLHALIYGNSRVLWRTHEYLKKALQKSGGIVLFPNAYRDWIEPIYEESEWPDEPESVRVNFEQFRTDQEASRLNAKRLTLSNMNSLTDDDSNLNALTRDGEMSLSLIPFFNDQQGQKILLNGEPVDCDDSFFFERINLNTISIPKSWSRKEGKLPELDDQGLIWLQGYKSDNNWQCQYGQIEYLYSSDTGFKRTDLSKRDEK